MNEKKLLELKKKLHEVEFKCSAQELFEYLIAKYTIEYSQNDKSKQKLKCIPTNAYFICEFFRIEYIEELDASIEKFYSSLTVMINVVDTYNNMETKLINKNFRVTDFLEIAHILPEDIADKNIADIGA